MGVWLWSVDTQDWMADGLGSSYWVQRIIRLAEAEGAKLHHPVVLMHTQTIGNPATVSALPVIIQFFRSHGYTFVALQRYLPHCALPGLPWPEITSRAFAAPRTAPALARAMLLAVSMHHGPFGLTACRVRREHDATGGSWGGPMSTGGW